MKSERIDFNKLTKIRDEEEIPGNFTSVRGEYLIPKTQKTGFYKENNCMVFASGDEDLREYFSAKVLDIIGMKHADIILVEDKEKNEKGCVSVNILKENEAFVQSDETLQTASNVEDYINQDIESISKLPQMTDEMVQERIKFLAQYLFSSTVISNTDIKPDNRNLIYNSETEQYRNPEVYDMGVAFIGSKNGFFGSKNSNEVLTEIYDKYYPYVAEMGKKLEKDLTPKKINKMMPEFDKSVKKQIKSELIQRRKLVKQLNKEHEIETSNKEKTSWIKRIHEKIKGKNRQELKTLQVSRNNSLNADKEQNEKFVNELNESVISDPKNELIPNKKAEEIEVQDINQNEIR